MRFVKTVLVLTSVLVTTALMFGQSAAPVAGVTGTVASQRGAAAPGAPRGGGGGPAMALTTTAWPDGGPIPVKYTQVNTDKPDQISPEFKWTNAPAGTQSFVFNMMDPDVAQMRGTETQVHWLVWNIPGTASGLPEGVARGASLPDGSMQISATGPMYRGPGAPATGPQHHYTFEVYALDTKLDVTHSANPTAGAAAVETRTAVFKAMQGHVLGKAVFVGLFRRPQ